MSSTTDSGQQGVVERIQEALGAGVDAITAPITGGNSSELFDPTVVSMRKDSSTAGAAAGPKKSIVEIARGLARRHHAAEGESAAAVLTKKLEMSRNMGAGKAPQMTRSSGRSSGRQTAANNSYGL